MQRLGGGGYTRKLKRGGGNDPSCGCDMQAGWPKFLTENIPLPSMKGGGSCGIPPIPNYYQGGGGCAACSGLPLPQPLQQGGGQPTVYNSNPVPDACPFPGTGYCNFYARGGSQTNLEEGEIPSSRKVLDPPLELKRFPFKGKKYLLDTKRSGLWDLNPNGSKGKWVGKLDTSGFGMKLNTTATNYTAEGGANYGEPMYLQARLRGGKQSGAGCGCGLRRGGAYRPTKKNLNALKKWRKGQSIGFTMTSSLKAKGLIPRTSKKYRGKKVKSAKYR